MKKTNHYFFLSKSAIFQTYSNMKRILLPIIAIILTLGVAHNAVAQNPVKTVKYFNHVYEGEVGKKKVPDGKGVMLFDGFKVSGIFQGNEVFDAVLTIDGSLVSYRGNLRFDNSQNVTLQPGGKIEAVIYKPIDPQYLNNIRDSNKYLYHSTYVVENFDVEKTVDVNYFDIKDFSIPYTVNIGDRAIEERIKTLLEVPSVTKYLKVCKASDAYLHDCYYLCLATDYYPGCSEYEVHRRAVNAGIQIWNGDTQALGLNGGTVLCVEAKQLLEKVKNVFILKYEKTQETFTSPDGQVWEDGERNVVGYKDNKGRIMCYREEQKEVDREPVAYLLVQYPDGNYFTQKWDPNVYVIQVYNGHDHPSSPRCDNVKLTRSDNVVVGPYFYEIYNNNHEKIARVSHCLGVNDIIQLFEDKENANEGLLKKCQDPVVLYNSESLSDSQIEETLKNQIFPMSEGISANRSSYLSFNYGSFDVDYVPDLFKGHYLRISNGENNIGRYYEESGKYISEDNHIKIINEFRKSIIDKKCSGISAYTRRFGFDPTTKDIKGLLRVGQSVSMLKDFFAFSQKMSETYYATEITKNDFESERLSKVRRVMSNYYKMKLTIDHGSRKCYDIIEAYYNDNDTYPSQYLYTRRCGYIWTTGDKVTSIVWY